MTVYQYQHRAEEFEAQRSRESQPWDGGPQINHDAGRNYGVEIRDGVYTTKEFNGSAKVTSSQINPHYGDGTVFSTARSQHGSFVSEIGPDTLITIQGVEGTVKGFENMGLIHRKPDGTYAEGSGRPDQDQQQHQQYQQADTADSLSMPTEVASAVDSALEGVSDMHLDSLVAGGIATMTGETDAATLERRLVSYAGVTPGEAAARVAFIQQAYQAQADAAITSRCGIAKDDLQGFYAWAKANQNGSLRDAINRQVRQSDLSGYRALAERYLSETPPTVEAVKAGGFEVRNYGGSDEVMINGSWITLRNAARLGYL